MRVLLGSDIAVTSPVFVGADGETPTDCDTTPTLTVTRDDGTVLTVPVVSDAAGAGQYSAAFLHGTHTTRLDLLTVTWTGVVSGATQVLTDIVEVVGGFYVTLNELRSLPGLERVPTATLVELRDEFQDIAEAYCGVAFVPRYQRDELTGAGAVNLLLSRTRPRLPIIAASSTDTAGVVTSFTVTNWSATSYGALVTDGDTLTATIYGEPNLTVLYGHGLDACPQPIRQACKQYVRTKALEQSSRVGRDLLSESTPDGFTQRWSTPDWNAGRPTGLLDVDRALNAAGRAAPVVA